MPTTHAPKLRHAEKHIDEIEDRLAKQPCYFFVIKTDLRDNRRQVILRSSERELEDVALLVGDAIANLRAALDHSYWQLVSPHLTKPGQEKNIQFPMVGDPTQLDDRMKTRMAHKVGPEFMQSIRELKPYPNTDPDTLIHALDKLDIPNRHKHLVPVADLSNLDSSVFGREIPDFPEGLANNKVTGAKILIDYPLADPSPANLGPLVAPSYVLYERRLSAEIEVQLRVDDKRLEGPLVSSLRKLHAATSDAIDRLHATA